MANSSTAQTDLTTFIPDKVRRKIWEVLVYKVVIDTINTDLAVVAADANNFIGLVAVHGIPNGAGNQLFTNGSSGTTLAKLCLAANQGLDYRMGPPIIWSGKGKAFVFQSGVVLDSFLMTFIKWGEHMPSI